MNEPLDFEMPESMIKYSKELLEEGKKYYGWIRISKDGIEELDWDKNPTEQK